MKTILITGCNRGLGLGLVKHLVTRQNPPENVIATCRKPNEAKELQAIADQHQNVHIIKFDVRDFEKYAEFSQNISSFLNDKGLNVLFNNAGMSPKFTRIQFVKPEQMMETYAVNTVAPVLLTKALLPALKQAVKQNASEHHGAKKALVVNMSSILASITANLDGGMYPYRCSKAALNMATKSISADLQKDDIIAVSLHPGWVKTDLGGPKAPMDVDTSVTAILDFINGVNKSHNGNFYQYDGSVLDW